jgi:hypothetical protein
MGPSEFFLLGSLNKYLSGKGLATEAVVKQVVASSTQALHDGFFHAGIQVLVPQWKEYVIVNGEYLEV